MLRNVNPAALVEYQEAADEVCIHLNWVLPGYRYLRCAGFPVIHGTNLAGGGGLVRAGTGLTVPGALY